MTNARTPTLTTPPLGPVPVDQLFTRCDPAQFSFADTSELDDTDEIAGQERAVEAIRFGIGMRARGYNLFALGPEGTGKFSLIRRFLRQAAAEEGAPMDWCYVNNFVENHKPLALGMPPGMGRPFAANMAKLIGDLILALPAAFESDEYQGRKDALDEELKIWREAHFGDLQKRAAKKAVALVRTANGLGLVPMHDDEVLTPEEFKKLDEAEATARKADMSEFQAELESLMADIPKEENRQRDQVRALNRQVIKFAVSHLMKGLFDIYTPLDDVIAYLREVQADLINSAEAFLPGEGKKDQDGEGDSGIFRRYQVNVIATTVLEALDDDVDEDPSGNSSPPNPGDGGDHQVATGISWERVPTQLGTPGGAPVIYEDHPTLANLTGRVEHISQYGTLVTDFNLIKPGALHRANGGYLILDARKLVTQPFAWDALKRALRSDHIRIEPMSEAAGWLSPMTLEPEPIPLNVKVVLTGDAELYYMLGHYDPEFRELFKVAVEFDNRMNRNDDTAKLYARLIGSLARKENLRPLDREAVARVVEFGARLAEDSEKLSTHLGGVVDLVREADYWASRAGGDGAKVVVAADVEAAIDARIYRAGRYRDRMLEETQRGTLLIETDGERVGQINGLSVLQLDEFAWGRPSRISCQVSMGKGELIDIEREVDLGGPLHSKGVMILHAYLSNTFAQDHPLSLSAHLVFEQSYGGIDGDSASSTELYALLSALADVPIRQALAVTGSVDQTGRVQAIGGVNEKIEGFFDLCNMRGLTGAQGVLIPRANVKHLMLRKDVVAAARAGQFHIYPIDTIADGLELLTGVPAGELSKDGYPIGSINRAVATRLARMARKAHEFAVPPHRPHRNRIKDPPPEHDPTGDEHRRG